MWPSISGLLGRFSADNRGVAALLFGIVLIPLMLGVGLAIDYSRALRAKQHLSKALDTAALAVGSWGNLNPAQINASAVVQLLQQATQHPYFQRSTGTLP